MKNKDFEIEIEDPTGDVGDVGPQGPQGPKGDTGPQGPAGADGKDGKDGRDGTNGLNGKNGVAGPAGPKGDQGVPGKDGQDGESLEFEWQGSQLGIKKTSDEAFTFTELGAPKEAYNPDILSSTKRFRVVSTADGSSIINGVGNRQATLKSLVAGTNVTITDNGTNLTIAATGGGGGGGGISRSVFSVSTSTVMGNAASTDYVYFCTGTINLTLPSPTGNTNCYTVKVLSGATTIIGTLDGTTNPVISVANTSLDIISNGTSFNIV